MLEASAPGRGRPDLELEGAVDQLAFGPPPVDPADLPDDELLRVAASLVADDVVAAGLPAPYRVPGGRPWRTRYRLVGDPLLADPRRADLISRGRPPGGRGSVILVLGTDTGQMLADAWTARSLAEGAPAWPDWIGSLARGRTVPPRVDLPKVARAWTERVGIDRVRIVLDPALIPRLVGRPASARDRARRCRRTPSTWPAGSGRCSACSPSPRAAARCSARRWRRGWPPIGGPALVVPPEHAAWVRARAERMRDALLRAGYAVHGDPDSLLPVDRAGASEPSDAGVLALALRLLLENGK